MRPALLINAAAVVLTLSGCASSILLRVYAVEGTVQSHTLSRIPPDLSGLEPLRGVKFFFYPNSSDSLISLVPEREFVTDAHGMVSHSEMVSPAGNRTGALIVMKSGYALDTVYFPFAAGDTINILLRMRHR